MKNLILIPILFLCKYTKAQPSVIIASAKAYHASVQQNTKNEMKDLKKIIPNILIDLKYATINNFTKQQLYKNATTTYLRIQPATALQAVQNELNKMGFGLKIFDAYRPYSTTKLMWDIIHNEDYVANPKNGSGHNRGTTIDLTIIDLKTKAELNMGTTFDNFTDSASHTFTNKLAPQIIINRSMLRTTMEKNGFKILETEWWHYGWISNEVYDVLDIPFDKMKKL